MKKVFSLLLALILALPILASCHGKVTRDAFRIPDAFDDSAAHELVFWAKNDTNAYQVEIYKKAIADFEALYPNVTVKLKIYTDYGKIYNDVITNIQTNTTPNICITYPDHIATYLTGENTVVPLDDLIANESFGLGGSELRFDGPTAEEVVPKFMEECRIGGRAYALPYMRSTEACYVNRTYVEALGYTLPETLTWDFIWEVAEKAMQTKGEDGVFSLNGQQYLIPIIYKSTDNMMISMLRQKGAPYSTEAGEILLFNDTARDILLTVGAHAKTRAFSTFKISSYPGNFLNAGQCIFAIDSTAGATWMGSTAPMLDIHKSEVVQFETAVMTIPQFDPENQKMISQGPSICIFNKDDPQEVLASWLFAQFLLTDEVQIAYSGIEGYVPVTLKAQQNPAYRAYIENPGDDSTEFYKVKLEASRLLLDHIDDTFTTAVFNGSASLRDAAGQLIEGVARARNEKKLVIDDAYIDSLFKDTVSLYRLDQIELAEGIPHELGEMPAGSVALLVGLGAVWVGLITYWCISRAKLRRIAKNSKKT